MSIILQICFCIIGKMILRITCVVIFVLVARTSSFAGEIILTGVYQGRNIFVRNPYIPDQNRFCITGIFVNNFPLNNLPKTSAIQIDLSGFSLNEEITIRIVHDDSCRPLVVNPEVIKQAREFEFLYVQVDDLSINWITTGESPGGVFELEKLKWEGWEKIIQIPGKGQFDNNQYSIEAFHYTGDNSYKLTYTNKEGEKFMSEEVSFYSLLDPIVMYPGEKIYDWISLSRETDYKIYNDYDTLMIKGFGDEINVSMLDYGDFYIILEDEPVRFNRPKPEIIPRKKRKKDQESKKGN